MTKREIIERGLKAVGKVRVQGDTTEPLVPFLLADIMYQSYLDATRGLELRHWMKQADTEWRHTYDLFNKPFFRAFPEESYCEVTDIMDDLANALQNEITMLRSKLMMLCDGVEFDDRRRVASFLMAHAFAQYADSSWRRVNAVAKWFHGKTVLFEESNRLLAKLRDLSYKMAIGYLRDIPTGNLKLSGDSFDGLFSVIAKKIYQWIKEN